MLTCVIILCDVTVNFPETVEKEQKIKTKTFVKIYKWLITIHYGCICKCVL